MRLFIAALAAAFLGAGCGSSAGRVCQPVNVWSAAAYSCSMAESGQTGDAELLTEKEPELEDEPEPEEEEEAEPEEAETETEPVAEAEEEAEAEAESQEEEEPEAEVESKVALDDDEITVQGAIEFESDSAELTDDSKAILDEMAKLINDNSDIKRVQIDVRTNAGSRRASKKLAKKRARALRSYLAKAGVKKRMLKAKGTAMKGDDEGDEIAFKVQKKRRR